jgi:hypothetical protein
MQQDENHYVGKYPQPTVTVTFYLNMGQICDTVETGERLAHWAMKRFNITPINDVQDNETDDDTFDPDLKIYPAQMSIGIIERN